MTSTLPQSLSVRNSTGSIGLTELLSVKLRNTYWRTGIDLFRIRHAFRMFKDYLQCRPFDRLPLKGVGVEVGVFHGVHLAEMLNRHQGITRIYAVDPYESYAGEMPMLRDAEAAAHHVTRANKGKIVWVKGTSNYLFPALDFAYIDGNHEYDAVVADIKNIWPKIKSGGVMGGHDFLPCFNDKVVKAVTEFAAMNNLTLNVTTPDWWIVKP